MRVETNQRLIRRNRQLAQYLFFGTFGVLILGLIVINQQAEMLNEDNILLVTLLQALVLPAAFISTIVSVRMTNLWVRQPRPEVVIKEGLKGISSRAVLYSYYHFPARHVLIAPNGVFAIITRYQDGRFSVSGERWKREQSFIGRLLGLLRFDFLGNPTLDARRAALYLQEQLQSIAPDVEVHPLVVFIDPRAEFTIEGETPVPVVYPMGKQKPLLKDVLRDYSNPNKGDVLSADQIAAFEAATLPDRA